MLSHLAKEDASLGMFTMMKCAYLVTAELTKFLFDSVSLSPVVIYRQVCFWIWGKAFWIMHYRATMPHYWHMGRLALVRVTPWSVMVPTKASYPPSVRDYFSLSGARKTAGSVRFVSHI